MTWGPIGTEGWAEIRCDRAVHRIARHRGVVPRRNQMNVPRDVGLVAIFDTPHASERSEFVIRDGRSMLVKGVSRPAEAMRGRDGASIDAAESRTATFTVAGGARNGAPNPSGWTLTATAPCSAPGTRFTTAKGDSLSVDELHSIVHRPVPLNAQVVRVDDRQHQARVFAACTPF